MKTKLPRLTKQLVEHIDSTPDEDYPLRILRVYRANCNSFWETHGLSSSEEIIYATMNEHQKQRAKILDRAIKKLINPNTQ